MVNLCNRKFFGNKKMTFRQMYNMNESQRRYSKSKEGHYERPYTGQFHLYEMPNPVKKIETQSVLVAAEAGQEITKRAWGFFSGYGFFRGE